MRKIGHYLINFIRDILNMDLLIWSKALMSNFLNIIILVFIIALSLGLAQGSVFPVDLVMGDSNYETIVNLTILHFLLIFLGLLMSLYPTYFLIIFFSHKKHKWNNNKGIITYQSQKDYNIAFKDLERVEGAMRKFLGAALFFIFSLVLVCTYISQPRGEINGSSFTPSTSNHIILYVLLGLHVFIIIRHSWYYLLVKKRNNNNNNNNNQHSNLKNISIKESRLKKILSHWHIIFPFLVLLVFSALLFIGVTKGWSIEFLITEVILCLVLSIYLIYFRTNRKHPNSIEYLKDDTNYLKFHRNIGLIVILFIGLTVFYSPIAEAINPLNTIIAFLISIYTIVILTVKFYLYYKYKSNETSSKTTSQSKLQPHYLKIYTIVFLIISSVAIANLWCGNKLHDLSFVKNDSPKQSLASFYKSYQSVERDTNSAPIFYAGYGGGLMAHYWNYLILDSIYNINQFQDIVSLSGVSGGGMGIGTFSASIAANSNKSERKRIINDIKTANILGIEMPWLLFADYIREMLPNGFWGKSKDRSNRSMHYYSKLLGDNNGDLVEKTSFYKLYNQLNNNNQYYPNIIFNSTSMRAMSGVVSAINEPHIFPSAINLLDYENTDSTLTYFEAISTCNRFPFVSPAAHVPTKGHFGDGGYYENSGLMSTLFFKNAIQKYESDSTNENTFSNKIKIVSVRNNKENYLETLLGEYIENGNPRITLTETNDFTETKAVIAAAINLERLPYYLRTNLETAVNNKYEIIYIDLPYYIKKRDVSDYYRGCPKNIDSIMSFIDKSNDSIAILLKANGYELETWGIINPPTARILSEPVEKYMEIMMKHPRVVKAIEQIYE